MQEYVIETSQLTKSYGNVQAVQDVSLTVKKGEIYGFLGLNGAGKTTTIRLLLGMINATKGSARVLGKEIRRGGEGPWESVGALVEIPYSYPELTVRENLEIHRKLRNLKSPQCVSEILEKLKLTSYADRKAGHLSLGNSQRLGLAKALIHEPTLLILDEPVNGLDPDGIVEIRNLLLDLAKNKGVAIFISSHILTEISRIADRFGIIHQGKLIQEMDNTQLKKERHRQLIIQTGDNRRAAKVLSELGLHPEENSLEQIIVKDEKAMQSPENINVQLVKSGAPPKTFFIDEEDLESYFRRIIHREGENS